MPMETIVSTRRRRGPVMAAALLAGVSLATAALAFQAPHREATPAATLAQATPAQPVTPAEPSAPAEAADKADDAPADDAAAQAGDAPTSTLQGVFSAEQVAKGKQIYTQNCSTCHGNALRGSPGGPPVAGPHWEGLWHNVPIGGLYDFVRTQMPPGKAGTLSAGSYLNVVAYILSKNGYPTGDKDLAVDEETLYSIMIEPPAAN